jgi:hypothetical protein
MLQIHKPLILPHGGCRNKSGMTATACGEP